MPFSRPEQLEQMLKTMTGRRRFSLGLPRPADSGCPLTLLTPEGASMLVSQGIEVMAEKGIGDAIHYEDGRYSRSGANIVSRTEALGCDVVLYAGHLTPEEAMLLKPHAVLLTLMNNCPLRAATAQVLLGRRITVMALNEIRDRRGNRPVTDILGEVGGRAAIATATALLADPGVGKGILLGGVAGVNPCEVVVLGTGMAALAAARSAIGLGGMVRLFDSDAYSLRAAMAELGPAVIGSALHPVVLGHALGSADVVVATALNRRFSIDESVLDSMKKGVVIFDLNDHDGISGVFPTLRCVDVKDAVSRNTAPGSNLCLINAAGAVPRTAAMALTNDIVPIIDRMFGSGTGLMNALKTDVGLRVAVVCFRGRVVSQAAADSLGVKAVDINLMLSFS